MNKKLWILIAVVAIVVFTYVIDSLTIRCFGDMESELSEIECEKAGGFVVHDLGDGEVIRARCGEGEFLGYVFPGRGESAVCCK